MIYDYGFLLVNIYNIIEKIKNRIYKRLCYLRYLRLDNESKADLGVNIKFKDIHQGEKCFILGNGPSLKNQNLELIKDYTVFTVNLAARLPGIEKIKPKYHFFVDEIFFDEKITELNSFLNYRNLYSEIELFIPLGKKEFAKKNLSNERVNYIFPCLPLKDGIPNDFNLAKVDMAYHTVVQNAISMAIYMGFKEIYLLGCDCTGIVSSIDVEIGENTVQYAYDVNIKDVEKLKKIHQRSRATFYDLFIGCSEMFLGYRILAEYCKKIGVKLINATEGGILDEIEKAYLSDVCKEL